MANMTDPLRGQMPDTKTGVTVKRQTPANAAGMVIPGDGKVSRPLGAEQPRSAVAEADAVGGVFGGRSA
jgi:hypothetical protein